MPRRVPAPSAIFVGRDEQLQRVEQALGRVPVAVIYGLPGIGKSTLAFAIAQRWGGPTVYLRVPDGVPLASVIDDARRAIAGRPVLDIGDDDERMADLAERLDDAQALLVIDDLHRLDLGQRQRLILGIGQLLRRGRLLIATRERFELGTDIDRLELRLSGLGEPSARSLWAALDDLHHPSPGFEAAWQRSQGNPLVLRQAHRGRPAIDPYAAAIASINADERYVACLLALADMPLSTVRLKRLLPPGRSCIAVRGLHARLIVDIHPDKTCALHDLFRDEMQRTMSADERTACHADLAAFLQDAGLDVVTSVREVCRHLAALDRFEEAAQLLVAHATALVRHGAARELLRGLEAIPGLRRTTIIEVIQARTLARLLDLHAAYQTLAPLHESGAEPRLEVLLGFGPVAIQTGRLAAAESVLDGRSHELRIGGRIRALKRQAMLREILYALSARQGHVVSKQEVARRLWGGRYDPTVHDNRLWANVRRLRQFLARSGLNIEFVDDGYRLAPSRDFVFVDPLA